MMFSEVHVHDDTELNFGVLLTVGFLPGLKVDAIPLLQVPKVGLLLMFWIMNSLSLVPMCKSK